MADNQPMEKPVLNQPVSQVQTQAGPSQTTQVPTQVPPQSAISPPGGGPQFAPPKLPKVAVLSLVVGLVALVVLGVLAWRQGQQLPKSQPPESPPTAVLSKPIPGVTPPSLPVITGDRAQTLRDYFKTVSPNHFKESFMAQVPQVAYDEYLKFLNAKNPEEKFAASRTFYIALTNPSVDKSDPEFSLFVTDVRNDLAKQTGKPLVY